MNIGRFVLGPRQEPTTAVPNTTTWLHADKWNVPVPTAHACNCIGPQPGETKCPCQLRAEIEQGYIMIRDGIVINGVEYELVPKKRKKGT